MSNAVFPNFPGLDIAVKRSAVYATKIQTSSSGKELRASFQSLPRYRYELRMNFLRQAAYNTVVDEVTQLKTFFDGTLGAWDSFLFTDPVESSVTSKQFGIGNGPTSSFSLTDGSGQAGVVPSGVPVLARLDWADPVPNSVAFDAYGDSITFGVGASIPANDYINVYATSKGCTVNNHGVSGNQAADQADAIYGKTVVATDYSTYFIGTNDHRTYQLDANKQSFFHDCLMAEVAWLAIPESGKVRGQSGSVTYGGSWSNSANYGGTLGKQTNANGATATMTLAGTVLLIAVTVAPSVGTFSISVDGVVTSYTTSTPGGANVTTGAARSYGPRLIMITGLTNTAHTVVITKTNATDTLYFDWAAGLGTPSAPVVVLGTVHRFWPSAYAGFGGSDATVAAFNTLIKDVAAVLKNVASLQVFLADPFSTLNNSTDLSDGAHPNDTGHAKLASAFKGKPSLTSDLYTVTNGLVAFTPCPNVATWGPYGLTSGIFGTGDGVTSAFPLKAGGTVLGAASAPVPTAIYKTDWQGQQQLYPGSRTNLLTYSEQIDNAAWSKNNVTITANAITAPDGASTADKVCETATTAVHYAEQVQASSVGVTRTVSVFVKAAERTWVAIAMAGNVNTWAWFNLATGSAGSRQSGVIGSSVISVGNGWYRISITAVTVATSVGLDIISTTGDGVQSFAGTAGSGIYAWGAQLEGASAPTSYIQTVATSASLTDYTLSGVTVTFSVPPAVAATLAWTGSYQGGPSPGAALTWTGGYYRRVRFEQDNMDLEQIVTNAWDGQTIKLISVK